ncbi:hypothetical protein IGI04_035732 [Brassica rapa subsp. trilocularis]|uniref:Uncharacterized protein n=1 Tax=Brassica rapa subsp. trilocularis TaxID=1813537 RepID=A0ABQ7LCE1_BRACM|nr:hypothetical protein IGI04_035732 [Brassica rapa subsp. trilocularis]
MVILESFGAFGGEELHKRVRCLAMDGDLTTVNQHPIAEVMPVLLKSGQSASREKAAEKRKPRRSMQHYARRSMEIQDHPPVRFRVQIASSVSHSPPVELPSGSPTQICDHPCPSTEPENGHDRAVEPTPQHSSLPEDPEEQERVQQRERKEQEREMEREMYGRSCGGKLYPKYGWTNPETDSAYHHDHDAVEAGVESPEIVREKRESAGNHKGEERSRRKSQGRESAAERNGEENLARPNKMRRPTENIRRNFLGMIKYFRQNFLGNHLFNFREIFGGLVYPVK